MLGFRGMNVRPVSVYSLCPVWLTLTTAAVTQLLFGGWVTSGEC
jgi:hypothetical protein